MGRKVRDRITGKEGIVVMIFHWITGCDTVIFEEKDGKTQAAEVPRVEIMDDSVLEGVTEEAPHEYLKNLGKKGRDRITGYEGVVIGLCRHAFRASQYCLIPPAKDGRVGGSELMDCSRVEFPEEEPIIEAESVQDKTAGAFSIPKKQSFI